jgi:hypothetical protein
MSYMRFISWIHPRGSETLLFSKLHSLYSNKIHVKVYLSMVPFLKRIYSNCFFILITCQPLLLLHSLLQIYRINVTLIVTEVL